jgi:hypothetical protein
MAIGNIITRKNVKPLLRLFDHYYKKGVKDAMDRGDDFFCRDFTERMRSAKTFGFLDTPYILNWKEWRFYAYPECRMAKLNSAAPILDGIKTYTGYIAAVLPMLMEFYLKGIKDWCDYPISGNWARFYNRPYSRWGAKVTFPSWDAVMDDLQIMIIDRFHLEEESENGLSRLAFDSLAEVIWRLTRKPAEE